MSLKRALEKYTPSLYSWLRERYRDGQISKHKQMSVPERELELCRLYKSRTGHDLDLLAPQRYTEKIQWSKLYNTDSQRSCLSDKYEVRDWVERKIGSEYLIPLLGVWEKPVDIDFDSLPNQFVLKTNNSSATNIIVLDKSKMDRSRVKAQLEKWLSLEVGWCFFELQYLPIKPMIIAEKLMKQEDSNAELMDYKFLCFGGEPYFVWVDIDRYTNHRRAVFDLDWNKQPWVQYNYPEVDEEIPKPSCFDEMLALAKKLCEGFDHVRVDLYEINGRPYFGEMTFTNGSGFEPIYPDRFDYELGSLWELPDCL